MSDAPDSALQPRCERAAMRGIRIEGMEALEVIRQFNDACARHDPDAAFSLCFDVLVFEATEPAPDGGRHVGLDAVRAVLDPILRDSAVSFEIEDTIALGDRAVQRSRYRWPDGSVRAVDLFTVRNDRITEILSYVKG